MATAIDSATAIAPRVVRVVFNSACADDTAIDPEAWTLALGAATDLPFYTPSAVSVVGVDSLSVPTTVDVTLDQEPTPDVLYSLSCAGVTGIAEDSIHNVGLFWPLVPAAPEERDFSIIDIVPEINVSEDTSGDLANFAACLQEVANLLWSDIDRWGSIFDIDKAPDDFIELILTALGSPIELPDLTPAEKRKLCSVLVEIYRKKSSFPGIKAAIKFFLGLPAQVANFYGMGFILGDGDLAHGDYPGAGGGDLGTWILGGGDAWSFTVKCGTPGGVALTSSEIQRVTELVEKMKPSVSKMAHLSASFVAPVRADIKDNGSGSVTITCAAVSGATSFKTFWRKANPGVNEWNGTVLALIGTGPASKTLTPGEVRYWVAYADNAGTGVPGLLTNELTNALTTPVLTATAQTRNIHLSWPAVTGATSYRIYKSVAAAVRPSAADNAATPIRISETSYDDPMETGTEFYYIVVPMIGDSEGFYSNEANATAL